MCRIVSAVKFGLFILCLNFVKLIEFVAYVRYCNFLVYFEVLPVLFPLIASALIRIHLCIITCKIVYILLYLIIFQLVVKILFVYFKQDMSNRTCKRFNIAESMFMPNIGYM